MAKSMDFSVLGVSGLKQSGGYLFEEKLAELRGMRGPMLYREMSENSPVIGAMLHAMKTWMAAVPWRTEPSIERNREAISWAEFIDGCREDMSHTWSGTIREGFSLLDYGWSLAEICYKRRLGPNDDPTKNSAFTDGLVGWRKLAFRAQDTLDRWQFDPEDQGLRGMWQRPPIGVSFGDLPAFNRGSAFIPIEKSLLFRTHAINGSPEGKSALRNCVVPYLHSRRVEDIEAIGIERDLSGYPVMEVPEDLLLPDADPEAQQMLAQMQQVVRNIRRDELEGLVIPCERTQDDKPSGYKFRLTSTGGQRAIDIDKTMRRYDQRMAMSLLAEFVLVGMEKGGSYALVDSKQDAFALSLRSIVEGVADVLNRFGVTRLCKLNGCPPNLIPKLRHGDIAAPPLKDIAQYVSQLAGAGMLMYDVKTERRLREYGDLPMHEESMPGSTPGAHPAATNAAPVNATRQTPEQEADGSEIPDVEESAAVAAPAQGRVA